MQFNIGHRASAARFLSTSLFLCLASAALSAHANTVALPSKGYINVLAGTGSPSGTLPADGTLATSAPINGPAGVAVDGNGNIYICDQAHNVIWEVTYSNAQITRVAGSSTGAPGYAGDGAAARSAELSGPSGVAVDSNGNLYIADTGNNVIRKVTASTGYISTVAGTGSGDYSGDGGVATSAKINAPQGVAVDSSNNIYIADTQNNRIRLVAENTTVDGVSRTIGDIYTVAGTGTSGYLGDGGAATSAKINNPYGLTLDAAGNIYIADTNNNVIRLVAENTTVNGVSRTIGNIYTVVGSTLGNPGYSPDGTLATNALLDGPQGVAIDPSGNLIIVDSDNEVVREVPLNTQNGYTAGVIYTIAGGGTPCVAKTDSVGDNCLATNATLSSPFGGVDPAGNIYVGDRADYLVRIIGNPNPNPPNKIVIISGNNQGQSSGSYPGQQIGATFQNPLVVEVQDASGNPVSGVTVTFTSSQAQFGPCTTSVGWGVSTNTTATSFPSTVSNTSGQASVVACAAGYGTNSIQIVASATEATSNTFHETGGFIITFPCTTPCQLNYGQSLSSVFPIAINPLSTIPLGGTMGSLDVYGACGAGGATTGGTVLTSSTYLNAGTTQTGICYAANSSIPGAFGVYQHSGEQIIVARAPMTVTACPQYLAQHSSEVSTGVYVISCPAAPGSSNPYFTLSGFVHGDTWPGGAVTGYAKLFYTPSNTNTVGTYTGAIYPSVTYLLSTNYTITPVSTNGTLTVH